MALKLSPELTLLPTDCIKGLRVDARGLLPEHLAELSSSQLAQFLLRLGNRPIACGDLFKIERLGQDDKLLITGDVPWLDGLGAGLSGGSIVVEGAAGHFCGAEMSGGQMHVQGSVGHAAGCQMTGGSLLVEGNAGNNCGGHFPGSWRGQNGGLILVGGTAGDHVGQYQRRGLIVICGNVASEAGFGQRAGTIVIGGSAGPRVGFGMYRGTICILRSRSRSRSKSPISANGKIIQNVPPVDLAKSLVPGRFTPGYSGEPVVLRLLARQLIRGISRFMLPSTRPSPAELAIKIPQICEELQGELRLFHGDVLTDGKGEVWVK